MRHRIVLAPEAAAELLDLRPFHRERVLDAIEEHLRVEPTRPTRRRKKLEPSPDVSVLGPLWELKIGDHRVFYRVEADLVLVVEIAFKGRKTTGEVLK